MENKGSKVPYGAVIERGEITEIRGTKYKIRSYDRDGIITPPLPVLIDPPWAEGCAVEDCPQHCRVEYLAGDKVCFVLFPDGTGFILRKLPEA